MIKNICNFVRTYRHDEKGATAVEFGLVALPFLLMLFGVIEAGRVVWTMNGVQYAVEETSRYASLNSDLPNEDFQDYAEVKLTDMYVSPETLQVVSSTLTSNGIDFVEVEGDYTVETMLDGFLPGDFGNFDFNTSVRKPIIN